MRYKYTYRTTARDLWQLSMYYIYGSLAGLCNIIFTVAAFALGFSRWDQAQGIVRCLIVLGCCLFTVIQPRLHVKVRPVLYLMNIGLTWIKGHQKFSDVLFVLVILY